MVHEQDEVQANSRKRSYPFIQWMTPSPPQSSPDKDDDLPPSLPSPPLQSLKYRAFKQGLDRFGGSGLKPEPGIQTDKMGTKRKTSWSDNIVVVKKEEQEEKEETDGGGDRRKQSPKPSWEYDEDERQYKRHVESEAQVSSSGQAFDHEVGKGPVGGESPDTGEDEEPIRKKIKYEIDKHEQEEEYDGSYEHDDDEDDVYQPSIAESIKLRDAGKSRRKQSESYDESDARTIRKIIASSSVLKDKKSSSLSTSYNSRESSHPYIRKSLNTGVGGTKIKVVPRTGGSTISEPTKIYIQIPKPVEPQENKAVYSKNLLMSSQAGIKNDKNHNKFKDTNYEHTRVSDNSPTHSGEENYSKPKISSPPTSAVQRPSSTLVSSSTETNGDDVVAELGDGNVKHMLEKVSSPNKAMYGARVILQAASAGTGAPAEVATYWSQQPQQQQHMTTVKPQHKERPVPYNVPGGGDRGFKQAISRSRKFNTRYPAPEKPRQKRAVIQDMVRPLKQWLLRHRHNPYPTKAEKVQLAVGSNMTLVQVSNWFANARRRLKNVVQESRCSWSKRLRLYNRYVQGNAELLSISSDDSIWNSEDDGGDVDGCDKSEAGHTDDYEDDEGLTGGPVDDHPYASLPDGGPEGGHNGGLVIDLGGPSSIDNSSSVLGDERDSSTPHVKTGVESRGVTPPESPHEIYNIPDTPKFKTGIMYRYLQDAAKAQESFLEDRKKCQSDAGAGHCNGESEEFYPAPDHGVGDISVGREELVYPTLPPDPGEEWQEGAVVDGNLIPPSNNITISFTNDPSSGTSVTVVPVISQPPRDSMGVDKVKRQLDLSQPIVLPTEPVFPPQPPLQLYQGSVLANGHLYPLPNSPPPPPQTPGHMFTVVSQSSVPQFSTSGHQIDTKLNRGSPQQCYTELPQHPVKGEPIEGQGRASSSSSPLVSPPGKTPVFPSHPLCRPPISVLPSYPFFLGGPLTWAPPFAPFPLFPLPDTSLQGNGGPDQGPPNLAPPPPGSWLVPHTTSPQGMPQPGGLVVSASGPTGLILHQPNGGGSSNWAATGGRHTARLGTEMEKERLDAAMALSQLACAQPLPLSQAGPQYRPLHFRQADPVGAVRPQPPTCT